MSTRMEPDGGNPPSAPPATLMCVAARTAFGAAAVSLCAVDREANELVYVAADGQGAHEIVGTRLPSGAGLAGFVAASGQSLALAEVAGDPRFARSVAERTGYVPTSMLVVPIFDENDVSGVLSVLDRSDDARGGAAGALELATAFADLASTLIRDLRHASRDDHDARQSLDRRLDRLPYNRQRAANDALHRVLDLLDP